MIADRFEAAGNTNLGLDREAGARHRGEDEPRLRGGAAAWVDEAVFGHTPGTRGKALELVAAGRFENDVITGGGRRRRGSVLTAGGSGVATAVGAVSASLAALSSALGTTVVAVGTAAGTVAPGVGVFRTKVSERGVGVDWLCTASTGAWDGDRPNSQTSATAATSSSVTVAAATPAKARSRDPRWRRSSSC